MTEIVTERDVKAHKIIKATQRPMEAIDIDGKHLDFNQQKVAFDVKDVGLVREIEARYGPKGQLMPGQVAIGPLHTAPEQHHARTFSVPRLPWKHYDDED
jgi:hypothetical protein